MRKNRKVVEIKMSVKILLAEDHGITRQGLRSLIEQHSDMEVVGEAEDGRKALELVRQLVPDILITDISMPNLNGIDATRQIVHDFPQTKVIALSIHSKMPFVTGMLKAGASGYLLKECFFDELLEAIQAVSAGGTYISPKIAGAVVDSFIRGLEPVGDLPLDALTGREREVLQLISEGKNTKEIALTLHVGSKAIEANRRKIMVKLNAHSVAELVRIAVLGGLTSLES
jgi:DNA-binding NarL/FixJ family response regulator